MLSRSAVAKPPINRVVIKAASATHPAQAKISLEPPAKRQRAVRASGQAPAASSPSNSDSTGGSGGGGLAGLLGDYGSDSDSINDDANARRGGSDAVSAVEQGSEIESEIDAARVGNKEDVLLASGGVASDRQELQAGRVQSEVLNEEEAEVLLDYE